MLCVEERGGEGDHCNVTRNGRCVVGLDDPPPPRLCFTGARSQTRASSQDTEDRFRSRGFLPGASLKFAIDSRSKTIHTRVLFAHLLNFAY